MVGTIVPNASRYSLTGESDIKKNKTLKGLEPKRNKKLKIETLDRKM